MQNQINVSTYIMPFTRYGSANRILSELSKCGFTSFDFTMMFPVKGFDFFVDSDNYLEKATELKNFMDLKGIKCNQTHGSVPCLRKDISRDELEKLFERTKRTVEITSILQARYCVLHPASDCTLQENVDFFERLKPIAKKENVIIAIENTISDKLFGKPSDIKRLLDALDDECFKTCLDIGHSEVRCVNSSAIEFISVLGSKIVCLHIHDNDKIEDLHQLPYSFSIDFDEIFKNLKKVGFSGDITFECGTFFDNMPVQLLEPTLKLLCKIGEYIKENYFN